MKEIHVGCKQSKTQSSLERNVGGVRARGNNSV